MSQFIGFSFPFRKGTSEFPEVATDDDLIKQSLVQIVMTGTGERVMRPDFGGTAHRYVFEPNDLVLQQLVQSELYFLISKYEPRVSVISITALRGDQVDVVTNQDEEEASLVITITYIVLASSKLSTLTISLGSGSGS